MNNIVLKITTVIIAAIIILGGVYWYLTIQQPTGDNSASQTVATPKTFKEAYDLLPAEKQSCVQGVLGKNFDTAYKDGEYFISHDINTKIYQDCFTESSATTTTFKAQFDSIQDKSIQLCVKNALGDEFDKVYNNKDGSFYATKAHTDAVNACTK
ncbi:MAG: hypothetical protein AAB659_00015 [Patescibacteria group bacterium]